MHFLFAERPKRARGSTAELLTNVRIRGPTTASTSSSTDPLARK